MNSSLLAEEAESDSDNKKGVAIEDEDPISEFTHKIIGMRLQQNIAAVLFRRAGGDNWTDRSLNGKTACRTLLHLLKLH